MLRYFFCIGGQKTGTTILARLLDSQPMVSCIWESYSLNPLHNTSILNPNSSNCFRHGFDQDFIVDLRKYWKLNEKDYFSDINHRYNAFSLTMPLLLRDFAQRMGSRFVGDKWPWYIRHLGALLDVFPDCKLIYTVRDPRAVWNSAQRFMSRERGDVVLWEIMEFDRMLTSYNLKADRLLTIRYEDILLQPAEVVAEICRFIGFTTSALETGIYLDSNLHDERWSWVPEAMSPVSRSHGDKWKRQMSIYNIEKIESIAGEFMERYGYIILRTDPIEI